MSNQCAIRWSGADRLARTFHEAYERLAPEFNHETRPESAVPWEDVPEQNKALMRAVCAEVYPWVCAQLVDLLRADVDHKHLADVEAERDRALARIRDLEEAQEIRASALRDARIDLRRERRESKRLRR